MAVTTRFPCDKIDQVEGNRTVVLFGSPRALDRSNSLRLRYHTVRRGQFPTREHLVEVLDRGQVPPDSRLLVARHKPTRRHELQQSSETLTRVRESLQPGPLSLRPPFVHLGVSLSPVAVLGAFPD